MQEQSLHSPHLSFSQLLVLVPQHALVGPALFLQGRFSCLRSPLYILQLQNATFIQGCNSSTDAIPYLNCHMQDLLHRETLAAVCAEAQALPLGIEKLCRRAVKW